MADLTAMLQAAAGAAVGEYQISRSLRFNSADSAYLSRTPASAGNRKTWTWSGWVKICKDSTSDRYIFAGNSATTDAGFLGFGFTTASTTLFVSGWATNWRVTTQVFRDFSAWYHIVVVLDTTQATPNDRIKVYVNGVQVTTFNTTNNPTQNDDLGVNTAAAHYLSSYNGSAAMFDGYLTEINFIDGQALTPSSFGETNATTGVWSPIEYTGTYGTNGFYLNFSDNTSTTTLGEDQAGSNDWTLNNFSVTAGAGNDSLVDTPTPYGTDTGAGGEVRGNYATWNPLNSNTAFTLSNGNLDASSTSAGEGSAVTTIAVSSGKWYCEITQITVSAGNGVGIADATKSYLTNQFYVSGVSYFSNGSKTVNNSNSAYGASYTDDDVIGIALDLDAGTVTFYKNGSSQGTAASGLSGPFYFAITDASSSGATAFVANFGQRPFAYTAPSGFKALVTTNLPDPTIVQGDDYFNTVLYTGTGSSLGVTGVGFQPDWVWIKERNAAADHGLYDAVRGVTKQLESNTDTAETTEATGLTAFGSDGFTVGALAQLNTSADTYVAWNWKANGAGVSNTAGTISSTVSVSTTSGFSIVTYTGNGSAATVGHGLGAAPKMIIVKRRDTGNTNWTVYHASIGATQYLYLDATSAAATFDFWNDTAPTSSVFSLSSNSQVNGTSMVAYCFAEVEGFSKFGSLTGNGSADGPFVFLGFRPAFVMLKRTDSTSNWTILDLKREGYNVDNDPLFPNLSNAETTTDLADLLSNGFKLRSTDASVNASAGTYVFAAFSSNPFKFSLGR